MKRTRGKITKVIDTKVADTKVTDTKVTGLQGDKGLKRGRVLQSLKRAEDRTIQCMKMTRLRVMGKRSRLGLASGLASEWALASGLELFEEMHYYQNQQNPNLHR